VIVATEDGPKAVGSPFNIFFLRFSFSAFQLFALQLSAFA
jgi:hypothetical protein